MTQVRDHQISLHNFSLEASAHCYWATNTEFYKDWKSISSLAAAGVGTAVDDASRRHKHRQHALWHSTYDMTCSIWAGYLPHLHCFYLLPSQTDWKVEMCGPSSSTDSFKHVLWSAIAGFHVVFKYFDFILHFHSCITCTFLQSGNHHGQ